MTSKLKLIVREIEIPWGAGLPFTGQLYAATPSRNKPRGVSDSDWCATLLDLATKRGKAYYAIPDSFWSKSFQEESGQISVSRTPFWFRVPDLQNGTTSAGTPADSIGEFVDHLRYGDDVAIIFPTTKISGLIPAIFSMLAAPDCHLEKILWPIEQGCGYTLTTAQRGYLAGLYDSDRLRSLGLATDLFGSEKDEEQLDISDESLELLKKNIYWTEDRLHSLGNELFHNITSELMDLTNFLTECEEHPSVDVTLGAMASISNRLCEVFKETSQIGLGALHSVESGMNGLPSHLLDSRLTDLRAAHGLIAERLGKVYESTVTFIPCDLQVLQGHPEIANNAPLLKTIQLIDQQLDAIFGTLDEIRVTAYKISQAVPSEPLPLDKGRDWKAMQAMLAECVQTCLEKADSEPPRWFNKPAVHPKDGESGEAITINHPTKPSSSSAWHNESRCAIFVPGGQAPKTLNGISLYPWLDHPRTADDWNASDLLMPELKEPAPPKSSLHLASGVVAIEPDGRIWMVSPTNRFGGYETTFPKGKLDHSSLSLQANAIKEGFEESGLKVRITGYLGDFKRTTSITRLYLAERIGGDPTDMSWESQAVRLVPQQEWAAHLQNPSDQPVLAALLNHFGQGN